jgi:hypothetical protein
MALNPDKLALIDYTFARRQIRSFADLGGIWDVDGGYSFYVLDHYSLDYATLADLAWTTATTKKAAEYPHLRLVDGKLGDVRVADRIGCVDAALISDVLLHQVEPAWDVVLALYAFRARNIMVFNPQWIGSAHTTRLLDLGEAEFFRNVPHTRELPNYSNLFRGKDDGYSDLSIWQWGITDGDLVTKMNALGFSLDYFKNCGQFGALSNFENHAFLFVR